MYTLLQFVRKQVFEFFSSQRISQGLYQQSRAYTGRAALILTEEGLYWQSRVYTGRVGLILAEQGLYWQSRAYTGRVGLILAKQGLYWQSRAYTGSVGPSDGLVQSTFGCGLGKPWFDFQLRQTPCFLHQSISPDPHWFWVAMHIKRGSPTEYVRYVRYVRYVGYVRYVRYVRYLR